jgi:hypothetical protein
VSAFRYSRGRASVIKGDREGSGGIVGAEGFAESAGSLVSLYRSTFFALVKGVVVDSEAWRRGRDC